jgi:hypothetical protein
MYLCWPVSLPTSAPPSSPSNNAKSHKHSSVWLDFERLSIVGLGAVSRPKVLLIGSWSAEDGGDQFQPTRTFGPFQF